MLTIPFMGIQMPVAYWPEGEYPYFWPGGQHAASEWEAEFSEWKSIAKYLRLDGVSLSLPTPF